MSHQWSLSCQMWGWRFRSPTQPIISPASNGRLIFIAKLYKHTHLLRNTKYSSQLIDILGWCLVLLIIRSTKGAKDHCLNDLLPGKELGVQLIIIRVPNVLIFIPTFRTLEASIRRFQTLHWSQISFSQPERADVPCINYSRASE